MTKSRMKISLCWLFFLVLFASQMQAQDKNEAKQDKKAAKKEAKADKNFIEQKFDKAMKSYESALKDAGSTNYKATLHLKTARLYLTLLKYEIALPHFEAAMSLNESILRPEDVCNYMDALRYVGQKRQATIIAKNYAYKDTYNKDQRYLNILHALNYEDGFIPAGTPEYLVERMDKIDTPFSEYWVGRFKDEYFYATSQSDFHDPSKRFYHRTKYYSLDEASEFSLASLSKNRKGRELLSMIPIDLQNGPLTFSESMDKMIVTSVDYEQKGENIEMTADGIKLFKTRLLLSTYNQKRNGWSSFVDAFPQNKDYSYAHPFLFNNDHTLLFSSDMPGGFGGYDLYIAQWDDNLQTWGEPVNLGAQVNTEGNEISPLVYEDAFVFASNGKVGFGGYDVYGMLYENGKLVDGSLTHFDYPINTVYNDFSMYKTTANTGFIISDRSRTDKDDVFYFQRNKAFSKDKRIFGMTESDAISKGLINLTRNEGNLNRPRNVDLPRYNSAEQATTIFTVYFDFDKSVLDNVATQALEEFIRETDFAGVASLEIEGYADEMGSVGYNLRLSQARANTVSDWLTRHNIMLPREVHGRGQFYLAEGDSNNQESSTGMYLSNSKSSEFNYPLGMSAWESKIQKNRKARKVEIKVILK